jgi:LysR family transcriptional regulator, glycine cleavage system transcriptional activator
LTPAKVLRHRLIHSVKSQAQWSRWLFQAGILPKDRWRCVRFDRSHMVINAACDGMGLALESNLMAWRELGDGRLVCPVAGALPIRLTTQWIVCPSDHLRHKKVRLFLDWLREEHMTSTKDSAQAFA